MIAFEKYLRNGKPYSLADSLVCSNGIISPKLAGKLRFLDSTYDPFLLSEKILLVTGYVGKMSKSEALQCNLRQYLCFSQWISRLLMRLSLTTI